MEVKSLLDYWEERVREIRGGAGGVFSYEKAPSWISSVHFRESEKDG